MQGLMAVCHEVRKDGYIGSHWPKHVAPPLYSTRFWGADNTKGRKLEQNEAEAGTNWETKVGDKVGEFAPRSYYFRIDIEVPGSQAIHNPG